MALFNIPEAKARAANKTFVLAKSANQILSESLRATTTLQQFDIFLSHSYQDADTILGIRIILEEVYKYKVYVDWINDRQLSRDDINSETAQTLRQRMMQSRSLFYATSDNAKNSKWMPWELGFKDGHNKKAAVMPILNQNIASKSYKGQEYLGVYPYVNRGKDGLGREILLICTDERTCIPFDAWLQGENISYRR